MKRRSLWRVALKCPLSPARFVPLLFLLFGLSFLCPFALSQRRECGLSCPGQASSWAWLGWWLPHSRPFCSASPIFSFAATRFGSSIRVAVRETLWESFLSTCGSSLVFSATCTGTTYRWQVAMGSVLFLAWRGHGRVALATARLSSALLWLGVLLLPAILSDSGSPSILRMIGLVPAVYLLVAVGMWEAFQFLAVSRNSNFQGRMRPRLPLPWGLWSAADRGSGCEHLS